MEGKPQTYRKNKKSLSRYIELIQENTKKIVPFPINSKRIDIEIFFLSENSIRADVDNIIKPILDAMQGIVYFDDKQVRSVRVTAIPTNDVIHLSGWVDSEIVEWEDENKFFIDIYHGLSVISPGTLKKG